MCRCACTKGMGTIANAGAVVWVVACVDESREGAKVREGGKKMQLRRKGKEERICLGPLRSAVIESIIALPISQPLVVEWGTEMNRSKTRTPAFLPCGVQSHAQSKSL